MTTPGQNGQGVALLQAARGADLTLWRTWEEVAPGQRFGFPMRLYLSEEFANRREASIGAEPEEKAQLLRGFKTGIICDALAAPPIGVTDFPSPGVKITDESTPEEKRADLARRAREYFDARDELGNQILWFWVESLFQEYWDKALPSLFRPQSPNSGATTDLPPKADS